ncbi:MAG: helix-turn-helix domain-containing protein [Candidatus Methylomirabilales bacterium]
MRNAVCRLARKLDRLRREYRKRYGLSADPVAADGAMLEAPRGAVVNLPVLCRTREHALQESVRWGEAYTFLLAPGVVSWVVPLVEDERVCGGLLGGSVRGSADDRETVEVVGHLLASGARRGPAATYVASLPVWALGQVPEVAAWLFHRVYEAGGGVPDLLRRNRENAAQQQQIAEEIHRRKARDERRFSLEQERALLGRIRAGDRGGARLELNRLLANAFLYSPRLPVVQGRAIELLGYFVRAAVEDDPRLEYLLEHHIRWIEGIVGSQDFEAACAALRDALDDCMNHIALQAFTRHQPPVRRVLDFLAQHYARTVSLDEVATVSGLSRFRIAHLVKECTGRTIGQQVKLLRIQKARMWLEETGKGIADIASDLGFADQSHFSRQFRELTGTTPARYRRSRREAFPDR